VCERERERERERESTRDPNTDLIARDLFLCLLCDGSVSKSASTLISLYIPPSHTQLSRAARMIREELSTAKHIKSRVTRNSVLTALKSVQHRLKLIKDKELRPNGVVIFCGYDIVKQKQICISVQPLHPTKVLVYRCGNRFYLKVYMFHERGRQRKAEKQGERERQRERDIERQRGIEWACV